MNYTRLGLTAEIQASIQAGMRQVSIATIDAELQAIGYRRMPDSRCTCIARNLTTGNSYPCATYGIQEIDTGMSAFHFQARRDERFRTLQDMRLWTFAVARGQFISI